MAAAALDNANPTILSAADLPTRQAKAKPRKGPDSLFDDVIFAKPSYLGREFCGELAGEYTWGNDAEGGFADEAIDEQEIYGESHVRDICGSRNGKDSAESLEANDH